MKKRIKYVTRHIHKKYIDGHLSLEWATLRHARVSKRHLVNNGVPEREVKILKRTIIDEVIE